MDRRRILIDACVAIDYVAFNDGLIERVCVWCEAAIVRPGFREVVALDEAACSRIGLTVVDGSLGQLVRAGDRKPGLSFSDHLALVVAGDEGLQLVTNDRLLHRAATAAGVDVAWGLGVLLSAAREGAIPAALAAEFGSWARSHQPHYGARVLSDFERRIAELR